MITVYTVALVAVLAVLVHAYAIDIRARIWISQLVLLYLKLENRYLRWRIARTNAKEEKLRRQIAEAQEDADAHPHP